MKTNENEQFIIIFIKVMQRQQQFHAILSLKHVELELHLEFQAKAQKEGRKEENERSYHNQLKIKNNVFRCLKPPPGLN